MGGCILMDVLTPLGPNDNITGQLPYTRKNIIGIGEHYIVSRFGGCYPQCNCKSSYFVPESIFPFTWNDVFKVGGFKSTQRVGWYLQQLIKLYAWKVIPELSDPYLVLDADTHFMKPTSFQDGDRLLFTKAYEFHKPYFEHISRLLPTVYKAQQASGVAHHMPMSHKVLDSLFTLVEATHGTPFWKAFLSCVDPKERGGSGASEYELVFNFTQIYFPEKFKLRELCWTNASELSDSFDFISKHWYL